MYTLSQGVSLVTASARKSPNQITYEGLWAAGAADLSRLRCPFDQPIFSQCNFPKVIQLTLPFLESIY